MFEIQGSRRIPSVMATQHPDNAGKPFWHNSPFISDQDETEELYQNFATLGNDEYMWDWEGKFADEAMIEKLLGKYYDFFSHQQIGRDFFVTLRIPNIWEEKTFKLSRAFMSVISAAEFTKSLGLSSPPVFELILPMAKTPDQLLFIQDAFRKTARFKEEVFGDLSAGRGFVHMIPIFESVDDLLGSSSFMREYLAKQSNACGEQILDQRVFLARSDPALNSGFVSASLACLIALSNFQDLEAELGVNLHPIIGCGALPFRGGLSPENIMEAVRLYGGARTLTVQSAFRYDFDLEKVKSAIEQIKTLLPDSKAKVIPPEDKGRLVALAKEFEAPYKESVERLAPLINDFAAHIPKRRSRVQHVGLFGYSRAVGSAKLPRAIGFTGALYTIGLPPEFIGTGRALSEVRHQGGLELLEQYFPEFKAWLSRAAKYINLENIQVLSKDHPELENILQDLRLCEDMLGIGIGPVTTEDKLHKNLTSGILLKKQAGVDFQNEVLDAAVLRKSLG